MFDFNPASTLNDFMTKSIITLQEIESKLEYARNLLVAKDFESCFKTCEQTENMINTIKKNPTALLAKYDQTLAEIKRKLNTMLISQIKSQTIQKF